jgi:membrane fusion protein (multidrug efflux system)
MKNLILALALVTLYSCSPKPEVAQAPPPPLLPVASVNSATQTTYQEYPASIEGTVNVEVRPQVSGALDRVYVDEGAYVSAGQPIFKINEQPYRAALNNSLASLHAAEAAQTNAQLDVNK